MGTNLGREHTDEFPRIVSSRVSALAQEPLHILYEMLFCRCAACVVCRTDVVLWGFED